MKIITLAAILFVVTFTAHAQNKSVYTDLADTKCKSVELADNEDSSYLGVCPGTAGYKLNLVEGDLRQSINVIDAKAKKHELQFWNFFSGFSAVGSKAEWRIKGKTPVALIVRLNVSENMEDSSKQTTYLIVAKITKNEICVTSIIKPSRTQNAEARKTADKAGSMPCKPSN